MDNQTHFSFTKRRLESLSAPKGAARVTYHDTHPQSGGLKLRVTFSGSKTYYAIQKLNGRPKYVRLGLFPGMTIEQARRKAKDASGIIADGKDPNAKKRADRDRAITLATCMDEYIKSRSGLKESTADDYTRSFEQYLSDWLDKPLRQISRDKVEKRHKLIGEKSPTRANKVMRVLRAVFEYAHGKYEDEEGNPLFLHNPVKRLSHVKAWYKEKRRVDFIKPSDLAKWWETVNTIPEWLSPYNQDPECIRDYLLLILFTGLRRREAASLKTEWADLTERTLTIPGEHTKNGHTHSLPLPDFLDNLLSNRIDDDEEYIFSSSKSKTGYMQEPKRVVEHIRNRSDLYFTVHGLRRTFITLAESLGIRDYTLKRLLNHRSSGDVTDGYLMDDVDRLREPMQMISEHILSLAEPKGGNVIPLLTAANKG